MKRSYLHLSLLLLMSFYVVAQGEIIHRYSFNTGDTTAVDSVGGKDGTLEAGATIVNNQLELGNAADAYVNLPADTLDVGLTSVTIEAWFTIDTTPDWQRLFDFGETVGGNGGNTLFCTPNSGDGTFRLALGTNGAPSYDDPEDITDATPEIAAGSEVHVACVVDGENTTLRLYQNGLPVGTPNTSTQWSLSGVARVLAYIGNATYDADPELDGRVNEFRIYDTALSPEEILASYNAGPDAAIGADSPTLTYPVGEENVDDYTPTLQWNDPINYEAALYYIYLDPNQANVKAVSKMVEPDAGSPLLVNVSQSGSEPNEYTTGELAHGERYYWKVEARKDYPGEDPNYFSSSVVSFTTLPDEPIITQQPVSQTVPKGAEATFTVVAVKPEDQDYHWFKVQAGGDVEVGEPNIPTLTITNTQKVDEGYYYCVVSNPNADVPSNTARLMVQRRVAWWNFDGQSINSDIEHPADPNEDYFTGTYFDPNDSTPDSEFNNTNPSPAGGYYIVFSGDTVESEGNWAGEAILVEPNEFFNFYPQGYTASAWVTTSNPATWVGIMSKADRFQTLSYPVGWSVLQYPGYNVGGAVHQALGYWGDLEGSSDIREVNPDTGNTWHLVTFTYNGDVAQIYVDGNLENTSDSATSSMETNAQPLVIGAEVADGYAPWDGQIDNVEIYNYALSRYDVAKLYINQVPDAEVCIVDLTTSDIDYNDDCIVDMKDFAEFALDWLDCYLVPTCLP